MFDWTIIMEIVVPRLFLVTFIIIVVTIIDRIVFKREKKPKK